MNDQMISALIDAYCLRDCVAILAAFAPDLLGALSEDIRLRPDDPKTLEKARRAVHEARAREKRMN